MSQARAGLRFACRAFAGVALWLVALVLVPAAAQALIYGTSCNSAALVSVLATIAATPEDDLLLLENECTYTLTAPHNSTAGGTGLPVFTASSGSLVINGFRSRIVRDANAPDFRLFYVEPGATLYLFNLDLAGGRVDGSGGAIHNEGLLLMGFVSVEDSEAATGGGGIYNAGMLHFLDGAIAGNSAATGGGIVATSASTATVVTQATIAANTAAIGGGIVVESGAGGVIVTSSTIADNASTGLVSAAAVTLRNTIVAGNRDGGDDPTGATADCSLGGGGSLGGDHDLFGAGTGCSALADSLFVDPGVVFTEVLSQNLADNGGLSRTLALAPGSRAIDRGSGDFLSEAAAGVDYTGDGDLADALDEDQRGTTSFPRVRATAVDIGAFEAQCLSPYTVPAGHTADLAFAITCMNLNGPGTHDVIELTPGTYVFAEPDNGLDGGNALPSIAPRAAGGSLTIRGNGAVLSRDSDTPFRFFHLGPGAELTLDALTAVGGSAPAGGVVWSDGARLTVFDSTFNGNSADETGGAIHLADGALVLSNSTLSGNDAGGGGGLYQSGGTAVVTNGTLTGNDAATSGGGIASTGGTLTVRNTIVAGNTAAASANNATADCDAAGDGEHNLHGAGTGCPAWPSSIAVDPAMVTTVVLDPTLGSHGGPTPLHALRADSPAIEAGDLHFLDEGATAVDYDGNGDVDGDLLTDQRGFGFPRIVGTAVDIGSFEARVACPTFPHTVPAADTLLLIHALACASESPEDDVIELSPGTYVVERMYALIDGGNGLPVVASAATGGTLTLHGNGAAIRRPADARAYRLFQMAPGAHLTMDDLTLARGRSPADGGMISNANGTLTLSGVTIEDSYAEVLGGAIYQGGGTLTLASSTLSRSHAGFRGGGIYNAGALTMTDTVVADGSAGYAGAGIYNVGDAALSGGAVSGNRLTLDFLKPGGGIFNDEVVTLTGVEVSGNVGGRGGGIHNQDRMTVTGCRISGNQATAAEAVNENFGGGLYNLGVATIRASSIVDNTAGAGGGIYSGNDLVLEGSLVAGNSANFAHGGGIMNQARLRVVNTTISDNESVFFGGGVYQNFGAAPSVITHSTIVNNRTVNRGGGIDVPLPEPVPLTVNNSIVAGNQVGGSATAATADCNPSLPGSHNLFGAGTGCTAGPDDVTVDPADLFTTVLEPAPADHGGPTLVHLLRAGSPAIDAGDDALAVDADGVPLTTDQRGIGFPRRLEGAVDLGAVEGLVSFSRIGSYFTVTPCRTIDSRSGLPLQDGVPQTFTLHGVCGVPATARTVVLNVTAVAPSGSGDLTLSASDATPADVASLSFSGGQTRALLAVVAMSALGEVTVEPSVAGNGTVHLVVDVLGFFE